MVTFTWIVSRLCWDFCYASFPNLTLTWLHSRTGCGCKNSSICYRHTTSIWDTTFHGNIRGPYCTTLTTAAFALDNFYDSIPKQVKNTKFASSTVQSRFDRFVKFIDKKENDANFLEAAASLHFLLKTRHIVDDDAVRKVARKMPDADELYVKDVLEQIRREELL